MDKTTALSLMKAPGDVRPGIWRGRVLQIKVTNICSLDCNNCTAAVGLATALSTKEIKRTWFMPISEFEKALASLEGYGGVVGIFGGNPALHPQFSTICELMKEYLPDQDQRGLWCNDLRGHAKLASKTFSAKHSNLNVHRNSKAFEEIERDWPEAVKARQQMMMTGLKEPSMHGSWWNAMQDVIPDEGVRWGLISKCFVNQTWSAEITMIRGALRAFFCEFAATRAEFSDLLGEPDTGMEVTPGWWRKPIEDFDAQICNHCHRCGAPLNPQKIEDLSETPEDFTKTNAPLFAGKRKGQLVTTLEEIGGKGEAATAYLGKVVMPRGR